MQRIANTIAGTVFALLVMPTTALGIELSTVPISVVHLGSSLLGLIVAVVLLIEALAVRRVALGGAIAEKMSYVILAIVCLAASALARWTGNFVTGFTLAQTELAAEFLVIVAMALLAAYFYSVRVAMQSYLRIMTDSVRSAAVESAAVSAKTADEPAADEADAGA